MRAAWIWIWLQGSYCSIVENGWCVHQIFTLFLMSFKVVSRQSWSESILRHCVIMQLTYESERHQGIGAAVVCFRHTYTWMNGIWSCEMVFCVRLSEGVFLFWARKQVRPHKYLNQFLSLISLEWIPHPYPDACTPFSAAVDRPKWTPLRFLKNRLCLSLTLVSCLFHNSDIGRKCVLGKTHMKLFALPLLHLGQKVCPSYIIWQSYTWTLNMSLVSVHFNTQAKTHK